jgi:DNA-binding PadR family transcriptional regulator
LILPDASEVLFGAVVSRAIDGGVVLTGHSVDTCVVAVPEILLALMEARPLHGYELRRQYDVLLGFRRPLRSGQIYSTLQRLQRDGLVATAGVEQSGGPERTSFAVTEAGTLGLERWFFEPEGIQPYLQPDLYSKVILALLTQRDAAQVLDVQRAAHRALMRDMTKVKSSPESRSLDIIAADLAILHLDADLRWIDSTERRLSKIMQDFASDAALLNIAGNQ